MRRQQVDRTHAALWPEKDRSIAREASCVYNEDGAPILPLNPLPFPTPVSQT